MLLIYCLINGLINCKRFAQAAKPWADKAWLFDLFIAIGGLVGIIFGLSFDRWKHLGSAVGPLLMSKGGLGHQRFSRRRHPRIKGISLDRCGRHILNIFFFVGYVFKHRFLLSSGVQSSLIWALCWFPFSVCFYTHSHLCFEYLFQPFYSKHYFLHILCMIYRLHFKWCCLQHVLICFFAIMGSSWYDFLEKTVPNMLQQKGALPDSNIFLFKCQEAPREAASRSHFSNRK